MSAERPREPVWRRCARLLVVAVGATALILGLWLFPTYFDTWTWRIRVWLQTWGWLVSIVTAVGLLCIREARELAIYGARRLARLFRRMRVWARAFPKPMAGVEELPLPHRKAPPAWVVDIQTFAANLIRGAEGWASGWAWDAARVAAVRRKSAPPALDAPIEWLLRRPLAVVGAACCVLLLVAWVPHYLTWPWWPDSDQFAISAQAWDAGILPYRDLPDFDFPGPIYLFWVLGKLFGWGATVPLNAVDAAMLAALGLVMAAWSKRLFGRIVPGLVGYLAFLIYYLNLDFALVAQRDWQAPFFAVVGLFALEAWPGRTSRVLSAAAMAAALAFRPQAVLFLPAVASAIDEGARRAEEPRVRTVWALVEWAGYFVVALFLAFAPLMWSGVLADFRRVLAIAHYGGQYNHVSPLTFKMIYKTDFATYSSLLWILVLLGLFTTTPVRRPARTWALVLIGILAYRPMSPVIHKYMWHPLTLVAAIITSLIVAWVLSSRRVAPLARLLVVLVLVRAAVPSIPKYASFVRSVEALGPVARGVDPPESPLGSAVFLPSDPRAPGNYRWHDYRALLDYVRHDLPPGAKVANFLRTLPYPAINGPGGCLSPFPAAGGILYLFSVDRGYENRFIHALEATPDVYVVWIPDEQHVDVHFLFPRLAQTIAQHYTPQTRFGNIEVWRRRPEGDLAAQSR